MDSLQAVQSTHTHKALSQPAVPPKNSEIYFWLPYPYQEEKSEQFKALVPYKEIYLMRVKQLVGLLQNPIEQPFSVKITAFCPHEIPENIFHIATTVMTALMDAGVYTDKSQIQSLDMQQKQHQTQAQIAVKLVLQ